MTPSDLYDRGAETLLASWEAYAEGAAGAAVHRLPGVAAAVFPEPPERGIYNNALLERDLADADRKDAISAMEAVYADAGVGDFAAWVHESDGAMRAELDRRGYMVDETTRAMGMELDEIRIRRPTLAVESAPWSEHLRIAEVPAGLLSGLDTRPFHIVTASLDGERVTTAIALDHSTDCGIYNVGTIERARRRGLGTAVSAVLAYDALARGCRTASLQSTPMAERVYGAVGFRDLGRIIEFVPAAAQRGARQ
jgi:GNAT superfamily N-acetyltransferase